MIKINVGRLLSATANISVILVAQALIFLCGVVNAEGLNGVYTVSGNQPVSITTAGNGNAAGAYSLDLAKPANATLLKAYLVVASKHNLSGILTNGQVTLDGASLSGWTSDAIAWNGSETFETDYLEITNQVMAKVAAAGAAASNLSFAISEELPNTVMGSGILAVWADPASDKRTVFIKLGVLGPAANTITTTFGSPWTATDSMQLGLGIVWSAGAPTEITNIDLNGSRLTSTAGGSDDGGGSTAYFTFGEETDLLSGGTLTTDHEYYEVPSSFLTVGTTQLIMETSNPSNNDGVFMLWGSSTVESVLHDYSDAPVSGTSYGEAKHADNGNLKLGNAIDWEESSSANADASGDGLDDDGISNFTPLAEGDSSYFVVATATNSTALAATLHAWVDFDGSGSFDADEYTSSAVAPGTNDGNVALSWSGLTDVTAGSSFARFRLTTDTLSSSETSTLVSDGEVEDYALTIAVKDFGDAPASMTTIDADLSNTYGEASHEIDNITYLGVIVDGDVGSQNAGLLSAGDDNDGSNDDDGVTFPLAGGTRVLKVDEANTVIVNASANGYLNAWIDWNQDGDWNDIGEAIATNTPLTAGTNNLVLTPSAMVPQGATYTRFRFTSASVVSPSPLGLYDDGEVEDYRVNLMLPSPIDVCSSVILNTGFESAPNPSSYFILPEEQVEGWATIPDSPSSGASYGARNGIEIWKSGFQGVLAFEGSYFAELNANVPGMLYQDVQLTPGSSYTWSFAHRGRSG